MPSSPVAFKERDVRRAVRAAAKEKLVVSGFEIGPDGTIRVLTAPSDQQIENHDMNEWNRDNRWARGYYDSVNDPWVEYDVDLTPGGTYELLDDEFATWRSTLTRFMTHYGL